MSLKICARWYGDHGERLADVLERELLGEMRADILADAVREHQIMRLVGGARIGRQTGGQQHQRGSRCETISSEYPVRRSACS